MVKTLHWSHALSACHTFEPHSDCGSTYNEFYRLWPDAPKLPADLECGEAPEIAVLTSATVAVRNLNHGSAEFKVLALLAR